MHPLIKGEASRIVDLLENELPYDFYQNHGFTWKLLKSIAIQDGEPIVEVEVHLKFTFIGDESSMPMIVFLNKDKDVTLNILLGRFEGCPVIYKSLRFNIKEGTVTFHMLDKDWKRLKSKSLLHLVEHRGMQVFHCQPVDLQDDDKLSVHRVDPVETFGLFAVQEFKVCDNASQLLQITKCEEEDNSYRAVLDILDPLKCNAKDMKIEFTPESSPTEININFQGIHGCKMRFSCPVSASSSTVKLSKGKVVCKIRKAVNMVSGEMALLNPAQVPFHAMHRWDFKVNDIDWTCEKMFRSKSDLDSIELNLSIHTDPSFFVLRALITRMFRDAKENSQIPLLYHFGLTKKPEDGNEALVIKVQSVIYKWNNLPYANCIFHDQQNMDAAKAHQLVREIMEMFGYMRHYVVVKPEGMELLRRMIYINAARTEQEEGATSVWKDSFVCPLYPREGVLNMLPENMLEIAKRYWMLEDLIGKGNNGIPTKSNQKEDIPKSSKTESNTHGCCAYCKKTSEDLKKCTGCQQVAYCNQDCQAKHWKKEHKIVCSPSIAVENSRHEGSFKQEVLQSTEVEPTEHDCCTFCKKPSTSLKKCKRCEQVSYCKRECQEKDWKKSHKDVCSASIPMKNSSEDRKREFLQSTEAEPTELKSCSFCRKPSTNLKKCTRCKKASYCNQNCQEQHWKTGHKDVCSDTLSIDVPIKDLIGSSKQSDMEPQKNRKNELDCCDVCEMPFEYIKRCTGCKKIFHCEQDCFVKDDREKRDKNGCSASSHTQATSRQDSYSAGKQKKLESTKTVPDKVDCCAFCKKPSTENLKKCTRCEQVSYCDRDCQRKHWDEQHKFVCRKLTN